MPRGCRQPVTSPARAATALTLGLLATALGPARAADLQISATPVEHGFLVQVSPRSAAADADSDGLRTITGPACELTVDKAGTSLVFRNRGDSAATADPLWTGRVRLLPRYGRAAVPGLELAWQPHPHEALYGLGERFNGLNQAGKACEMWIRDAPGGGANLDDSYFCTPVLYSSAGYALFATDNPEGAFDLDAGRDGWRRYRRAGTSLSFYLIAGENLPALVRTRGQIVGPFRGVPDWAWGPWISRNSYENQAEAEAALAEMRRRSWPVAAIVQEAWKGRSETGDFNNFSGQRWPRLAGYLAACIEQHVGNILWQTPIVHPVSPDYPAAAAAGYFVRGPDGAVRLRQHWLAGFANLDFTHPAGVAWWQDQMRDELRAGGVCGFKADDGEDIQPLDVFHDGRRGWEMHNLYSTLYNQALVDLLDAEGIDGMIWARSGSLGIEQCPALWAGDQYATWPQLRALVPAGLSTSISGMPFWGHDIGGYLGDPSPELYIRWLQFGAFSPLMQYHGVKPREPWAFGADAEKAYNVLVHLRMALAPMLRALGREAAELGTPIMQPMIYAFPGDERFLDEDTQFMLGPDLLVAPVLEEGAYGRRVKFPTGRWRHLLSPVAFDGPADRDVMLDLATAPVFVRAGADLRLDPAALPALAAALGGERTELPPEPILHNVAIPLIGNAFTGAATARLECDPRWQKQLVVSVSPPGAVGEPQNLAVEWQGRTGTFRVPAPADGAVPGAVQPFAVTLAAAGEHPRVLYHGAIRWEKPATLALALERDPAGAPAVVATVRNRTNAAIAAEVKRAAPDGEPADAARAFTLEPYEIRTLAWALPAPAEDAVASCSYAAELRCNGEPVAREVVFSRPDWRWVAVGPFPADDGAAHRTAFGPEWDRAPDVAFALKDGAVRWEQVAPEHVRRYAGVDFRSLYGEQRSAAAYVFTRISSDRPQPAELRFGSDDTLRVWLNGRQVYAVEAYRTAGWDQEIVPVELQAGVNTLLVKVGQDVGAWQLHARLTGPAGTAITGVSDGFEDFAAYAPDRPAATRIAAPPAPLAWSLAGPLAPAEAAGAGEQLVAAPKGISWPPQLPGITWTPADDVTRPDGLVVLHARWPQARDSACLAATTLGVDAPTPVELVVGSDDGITLWLNGEEILRDAGPRVFNADAHRVSARLVPGNNTLLARIDQGGGDWMFRVAVWDLSVQPPRLLQPRNLER